MGLPYVQQSLANPIDLQSDILAKIRVALGLENKKTDIQLDIAPNVWVNAAGQIVQARKQDWATKKNTNAFYTTALYVEKKDFIFVCAAHIMMKLLYDLWTPTVLWYKTSFMWNDRPSSVKMIW